MQLDPLEIMQDVPTRWNSKHATMARLVKLRTVITVELSESDAVPNLNASDWKLMNAAVQVLKPLDHATTELSEDRYPTLSQVIPLLQCTEVVLAEHVSQGVRRSTEEWLVAHVNGTGSEHELGLAILVCLRLQEQCVAFSIDDSRQHSSVAGSVYEVIIGSEDRKFDARTSRIARFHTLNICTVLSFVAGIACKQ
ncbi:hypothetical protein HPB49_026139 [Dermacentor silvarum]|nr:hypothetical protein HPB49_026139 [Dermacentor silvarum]